VVSREIPKEAIKGDIGNRWTGSMGATAETPKADLPKERITAITGATIGAKIITLLDLITREVSIIIGVTTTADYAVISAGSWGITEAPAGTRETVEEATIHKTKGGLSKPQLRYKQYITLRFKNK